MGADCKSVGLRLRRFESCTCHHVLSHIRRRSRAILSSTMPPADGEQERRQGRALDCEALPGFTASRAMKLAAGWDDGGLWDDVAWLGEHFWAAAGPADRAVRWHHLVLAVGNFKRPRARWLSP